MAPQAAPQKLSLSEAIRLALANRQELKAAAEAVEAAAGATLQASLGPNPVLSIQSENWRAWGDPTFAPLRDLDYFTYITQQIETNGKRRKRTDLAEIEGQSTRLARAVLAWRIEQEAAAAWWAAVTADARLDVLGRTRRTLAELVQYHESRLEQGAIAEIDLIKVQVEEQKLVQAQTSAENEREQARLRLASTMGLPRLADGVVLDGEIGGDLGPPLAATDWMERARAQRPDWELQKSRIAAAEAAVTLAQAHTRPDVTPYFGYKRTNDMNTIVGGVNIPLLVRDRNQGRILEAQAQVREEVANLRALATRTEAEVTAAMAAAARGRAQVESLEAGLLERARESFRIARAAFQEQGADLLFLLDAQRAQNDVELLHAQALADYRLSVARLEAAAGGRGAAALEVLP
ncbi:MAG: hypothetical protein GC160_21920 [Acidobacteria bacterium]|nr:hypothetical protein [Acidobacteriota bacterium]